MRRLSRWLLLFSFLGLTGLSFTASAQGRSLPDFTVLVEQQGPAVVNITANNREEQDEENTSPFPFPIPEDDPFFEFFKRFMPPGQGGGRSAPTEREAMSYGSGFILSTDGFIMTNAHVVAGASQIQVKMADKREFSAKLIGMDKRTDVAVLKIEDLLRDGYASIFIGTGTWKPRNLGIHGECLGNVHFGIDYLANASTYNLGKNVAVIGMGNAAMDVARTALRNGAEHVTLYARGNEIAASSHEVSYATLDGAEFVFGMQIDSINEKGPVFKKTILDEEENIIGEEEELIQVEADSTIISISQGPRKKLIRTTFGLEGSDKGLLIVDDNYMTTKPGVFAAGDVITGSKTVVHAVDGAKKAAEAMIQYMENL